MINRYVSRPLLVAITALLASGCTAATGDDVTVPSAGPSPSFRAGTLPTPGGYRESCALHPQICSSAPAGGVPAGLWRPLRFPAAEGECPVTLGERLERDMPFAGVAFGAGPVRAAMVLDDDAHRDASVRLIETEARDGWYGRKTLWFSYPTYDGPVLLRGTRLDAPGEVAFGEGPVSLAVQVPPGPGVNVTDGFRHWPGATWVRGPGCYGLQADGDGFSVAIVLHVRE